jgi:predicted ATP-grasp superfamily ATP-dependent carboligase
MRVFITDGETRAALAATRSLGSQGHEVIVGERRSPSLAQSSRYCAQSVIYPDPGTEVEAFGRELPRMLRALRVDVLLPIADITTFLVTHHREEIEAICALPVPSSSALDRAADKAGLLDTARRLGVPAPRSVRVERPGEAPALDFGYPVVIKPHRSRVQTERGWMSCAVGYARSPEQLAHALANRPAHEYPLLLQERIEGPGVGVFACYDRGRAVALFSHKRIRERPPWGGVSVLSESAALPPAARDFAVALLDDLRWHGVAMVEFKQDRLDDTPKLMEINGRFWGSLQLAIDAGVDFPALLIRGVRGESFAPQPPYAIGVRSRWLWGDVDHLLLTLVGSGGAPGPGVGRWRAVRDFLAGGGAARVKYENPRLDDLRPFLYETRHRLGGVLTAALARFGGR